MSILVIMNHIVSIVTCIGKEKRLINTNNEYIFNVFHYIRVILNRSKLVIGTLDASLFVNH
jgi:hypothetical protein